MRVRIKPLLILFALLIGFTSSLLAGKEYKYSYIPKKAYENQLFSITVLEIGSTKERPKFSFDTKGKNQPLFKNPLIVKNGNDSFYTFYFKADSGKFHLPKLTIQDAEKIISLGATDIPIVKLKSREEFSGVLAAEMKIKTSQASTYDSKNNLVTLSIEAFEANLENMHLKMVIEDGIENIKRQNAKVRAEYYAVIPATQKHLKFTYFNTIKGQYLFLDVPIVIKDYSVSAQSEINPKDDSFDKLKKSTFIGLSIFFFLLFLWKRDFFYLIIAVVTVITLLTFYTPKKDICVKQGSSLYILPTHTSRVSIKVDDEFTTPLLGERTEFNKIEYKNNTIGWIKDEDLCKN
ncbi:MAG: hypothetical protein U9R27_04890 [Campylobacterota bacterium]|nr:hypothetical protein [Campylobacterota bacterium]